MRVSSLSKDEPSWLCGVTIGQHPDRLQLAHCSRPFLHMLHIICHASVAMSTVSTPIMQRPKKRRQCIDSKQREKITKILFSEACEALARLGLLKDNFDDAYL